jgi:uncharacterized membrane protein (UPF0127 family)
MRLLRLAFALVLVSLALQAPAQLRLRTMELRIAGHPLKVEVAEKEEDQMRGLMFRARLGKDEGMVFVHQDPEYLSMWMKNTMIPLSVAFVADDGTILNILDMEPQTLDSHMSAGPARYAIETNKGWFAQKKIKAGDRVTGLPKPAKSR